MKKEEWFISIGILDEESRLVIQSCSIADLDKIDRVWTSLVKKHAGKAIREEDLELENPYFGFFRYRFEGKDDIWLRCEVHLERIPF